MTKEECIKVLQALWRYKDCGYSEREIRESLDIAIKALEQQPSDDCISRQAVLDKKELIDLPDGQSFYSIDPEDVKSLPPVTPTHGTCKDCSHRDPEDKKCDCGHSIVWQTPRPDDWYCKDYEKRGDSDGSN